MINDIDNDDTLKDTEDDNKYRIKNEYNWKEAGGQKILDDSQSDSVSDEDSSSSKGQDAFDYAKELFGPIGLKQCEDTKIEEKGDT